MHRSLRHWTTVAAFAIDKMGKPMGMLIVGILMLIARTAHGSNRNTVPMVTLLLKNNAFPVTDDVAVAVAVAVAVVL